MRTNQFASCLGIYASQMRLRRASSEKSRYWIVLFCQMQKLRRYVIVMFNPSGMLDRKARKSHMARKSNRKTLLPVLNAGKILKSIIRVTLTQRRIIKIPDEYLEVIDLGNVLFPSLYQLENGLRLAIHSYLTTCYGSNWWDISLKVKLPIIWQYADDQQKHHHSMPWIGNSARVKVLPIHLVTLGHLEEIIKKYKSDCIPQLFPTLEFFLGHMEVVKRVRNLYSHMFPCITKSDCEVAKREIMTLASHINTRL
jgi:hypothetical protein